MLLFLCICWVTSVQRNTFVSEQGIRMRFRNVKSFHQTWSVAVFHFISLLSSVVLIFTCASFSLASSFLNVAVITSTL
uniref:Secreted peptide n=1 Tax=Rhipicephalus pulchellus TaxID=72859 RepID=L7LV24_RHIPC